jgi:hypothetical protein
LPSNFPSGQPTLQPSVQPTSQPSTNPSRQPSSQPSSKPTTNPTSAPSYIEESWGQIVWDKKRRTHKARCNNQCSSHGTCMEKSSVCQCFDGWTGIDCFDRACPKDIGSDMSSRRMTSILSWSAPIAVSAIDKLESANVFLAIMASPVSNVCPDDCNYRGVCFPEKFLADKAGVVYETPWDAMKSVGCVCDIGYRGMTCAERECSTGPDPLGGFGNEAGRDCSGRGLCDYETGLCQCFGGFYGSRCQHNRLLM